MNALRVSNQGNEDSSNRPVRRRKQQPYLIRTFFVTGNHSVIETVLKSISDLGQLCVSEGGFPYIRKETTRGERIEVIEVEYRILEALWVRRRQGETELQMRAYQLLSNGLLREVHESGRLCDEAPVRDAARKIRQL